MSDPSVDQQTLHDKFNNLEQLSRDLIQHLEKGFIPKANKLTSLLRKKDHELESVKDITLRNQVNVLLESERYTDQLYRKISDYCESINRSVTEIEREM